VLILSAPCGYKMPGCLLFKTVTIYIVNKWVCLYFLLETCSWFTPRQMSIDEYDREDRLRLSPVTVTAELSLLQNTRILRWNMAAVVFWAVVHTAGDYFLIYIGTYINRALETSLLNSRKSFVYQEAFMYAVYVCIYVFFSSFIVTMCDYLQSTSVHNFSGNLGATFEILGSRRVKWSNFHLEGYKY
jgi:hypothetical protein